MHIHTLVILRFADTLFINCNIMRAVSLRNNFSFEDLRLDETKPMKSEVQTCQPLK